MLIGIRLDGCIPFWTLNIQTMELCIKINRIKCINHLDISLPVNPGLYAITGQNGSGKSTIVTCASSVFFDLKKDDYFGYTETGSSIEFEFEGKNKKWTKDDSNNWICDNTSSLGLMGFY